MKKYVGMEVDSAEVTDHEKIEKTETEEEDLVLRGLVMANNSGAISL